MRTDEHAEGLCRALSLPVEPAGHVIFKSVPAVWKDDAARQTGFLPPPGSSVAHAMLCSREDEWVGIEPEWLGAGNVTDSGGGTCQACAGFGCQWCEVAAGASDGRGEGGLWDAALAPM